MKTSRAWGLLLFGLAHITALGQSPASARWPADSARAWYSRQPWIVGCNFIPSTAINQLEMWQAETFDPAAIDRELGWARTIGFNAVRVFLHVVPWESDSAGFFARVDRYLSIAQRHGIRTMFVLFDDCWNEDPLAGPQPRPKPGVHNSGWMQCPGKRRLYDSTSYPRLLDYTRSVVARYATEPGVLMWDLYNEPGNSGYGLASLSLLRRAVETARGVGPSQPITVGTWMPSEKDFAVLNEYQASISDVVTFHSYADSGATAAQIRELRKLGRPLICTEYMARTRNSRFASHLPMFKSERVGAISWGLVSGKSNTIFPWGSPEGSPEPLEWFHDIFRGDGTPYRTEETNMIRHHTDRPAIAVRPFGTLPDGRNVSVFTLRAANGMEAGILDHGGTLVFLSAPDRRGAFDDVVLGFDDLNPYVVNRSYFGGLVGRYGNRIAGAQFTLDGTTYALAANDGPNHLHGGINGFHRALWNARPLETPDGPSLLLTRTSPDGEEGYPGTLNVTVTYTLTHDGDLRIEYEASSDRTTVVNLTHHAYFNLAGPGRSPIVDHRLQINADAFTPVDRTLIPTGEIRPVEGTPFDFRTPTTIGRRIADDDEQLRFGRGYDHNWVLRARRDASSERTLAARVSEPSSGRVMEVWTTEPGLQFYSGNFLDGSEIGKGATPYRHRTGFCLETQHFPDTPNQPSFPSVTLQPGVRFVSSTVYRFTHE